MLVEKLPVFIQSGDLEVQERACCILQVRPLVPATVSAVCIYGCNSTAEW